MDRWLDSPPRWVLRARTWVSGAFPLLLVGYGLAYENAVEHRPLVTELPLRVALYAAAGLGLYMVRRAPYVLVLTAVVCWVFTSSALFVIAGCYLLARWQPPLWWGYILLLGLLHPLGLVPEPQVFASGHALLPHEAVPVYSVLVPALAGFAIFAVRRSARLRQAQMSAEIQAARSAATTVVAADRLRLSRDMHDIVGRQLTLMVLHATALAARATDQGTIDLARTISTTGGDAVRDLHYILGVLRQPDEPLPSSGPTPDAAVREALADARRHGARVQEDFRVPLESFPSEAVGVLGAMLSETLHNALKYAPQEEVVITVDRVDSRMHARVVNAEPQESSPGVITPGGFGLAIVGEYAAAEGGRLTWGRLEDGGFAVELEIPVE